MIFILSFLDWSSPSILQKQLYSDRLSIIKTKWDHLQELKKTLPPDFHSFYNSIPLTAAPSSSSSVAEDSKTTKKKVKNKKTKTPNVTRKNKNTVNEWTRTLRPKDREIWIELILTIFSRARTLNCGC